jgi:hypothetical protein
VLPIFPAKADISLSTLIDPHFGQATDTFSSRFRKRTSKLSLHFRHLNSNIGIGSFPPAEHIIPAYLPRMAIGSRSQGSGRVEESPQKVKADPVCEWTENHRARNFIYFLTGEGRRESKNDFFTGL